MGLSGIDAQPDPSDQLPNESEYLSHDPASPAARGRVRLEPQLAIRPGTSDPQVVVILWCMRRAFFPLLWVGMGVAVIALGEIEAMSEIAATLEAPSEFASRLWSPMGAVVAAVGLRIATSLFSLVAVLPLTRSHLPEDQSSRWRPLRYIRLWRDRTRYARAYRALRWTWEARDLAYRRLGSAGRPLALFESALRWIGVTAFLILIYLTSSFVAG